MYFFTKLCLYFLKKIVFPPRWDLCGGKFCEKRKLVLGGGFVCWRLWSTQFEERANGSLLQLSNTQNLLFINTKYHMCFYLSLLLFVLFIFICIIPVCSYCIMSMSLRYKNDSSLFAIFNQFQHCFLCFIAWWKFRQGTVCVIHLRYISKPLQQ